MHVKTPISSGRASRARFFDFPLSKKQGFYLIFLVFTHKGAFFPGALRAPGFLDFWYTHFWDPARNLVRGRGGVISTTPGSCTPPEISLEAGGVIRGVIPIPSDR